MSGVEQTHKDSHPSRAADPLLLPQTCPGTNNP